MTFLFSLKALINSLFVVNDSNFWKTFTAKELILS